MIIYFVLALLIQTQQEEKASDLGVLVEKAALANPSDLPRIFLEIASTDADTVEKAEAILPFLTDNRSTINQLISDDTSVCRFASEALVEIGEASLPGLLNTVDNAQNLETKIVAMYTIRDIGIHSRQIQVKMESIIRDFPDSPALLEAAIFVIGVCAQDNISAIEVLTDMPEDVSFVVRMAVAHALGEIETDSIRRTNHLIKMTFDKNNRVQLNAISSLGKTHDSSHVEVLKRLTEISEDGPEFLRIASQNAFQEISGRKETKRDGQRDE